MAQIEIDPISGLNKLRNLVPQLALTEEQRTSMDIIAMAFGESVQINQHNAQRIAELETKLKAFENAKEDEMTLLRTTRNRLAEELNKTTSDNTKE